MIRPPENCSLQALLMERAGREWLTCLGGRGAQDARAFDVAQIVQMSLSIAAALERCGARRAPAILICENDERFVCAFFAILLAQMIPTPFPTPHFAENRRAYQEKLESVLRDCSPGVVLVSGEVAKSMPSVDLGASTLVRIDEALSFRAPSYDGFSASGSDTALIQYTSGSTGRPRGAELSHRSILANVTGIGEAVNATEDDVGVSWLPLFHDMGLIGSLLFTLAWGMRYVLLAPRTFVFKPATWLQALSRYRGTLSPAPNFAYDLCVDKVSDDALSTLDLSSWRVAFNGSEMVRPETLEAFSRRFGPAGFRGEVLPVYGLAENCLATTFPRLGFPVRVEHVNRGAVAQSGRVVPERIGEGRKVVSVGRALKGQRIRVVGRSGQVVPDLHVGDVEIHGPCLMKGYYGKPEETARRFTEDGWLKTGDCGYVSEGELFLTGRTKDVIKKQGLAVDAADVQAAVALLQGLQANGVAAFGVLGADGSERLVVVVETKLPSDSNVLRAFGQSVFGVVLQRCRVRPDEVVLVRSGCLPRTTSGKVRNGTCKRRYADGALRMQLVVGDNVTSVDCRTPEESPGASQ